MTLDTKLIGEIEILETNRATNLYKIVLLHGIGNFTQALVYLPRIVSVSNAFIYQEQNYYTGFSDAVESLWMRLFEFQDKLDEQMKYKLLGAIYS